MIFKKRCSSCNSKIEQMGVGVVKDDIQKIIIKKLYSSTSSSKESIKIITNILLTSRYLERIGDHAVSIGERVQYFLTGDYKVFHCDS